MRWQHIQYEDGSNPYICKTEKEFKRIKRKYGKRLQLIEDGFWIVYIERRHDPWKCLRKCTLEK